MINKDQVSILIVDDEEDIRDVLEIALKDIGYTVFLAENGKKAFELFKLKRPDIVITDIKMPVMDGIELLRQIKRESPETEVLMITGHGDMH
ncbi:MAG: response regulator, partial [Desulfobacula sp.]|nr:response regulator [Desulfobacula sp.]